MTDSNRGKETTHKEPQDTQDEDEYRYRVKGHWDTTWQSTEWMDKQEAEELYRHIRSGSWHQLSLERTDGDSIERKAGPDSDDGWYDAESEGHTLEG